MYKITLTIFLVGVFGAGFFLSMFTYNQVSALFFNPQTLETAMLSDEEYEKEFLHLEEVVLFKEKYHDTLIDRVPMSVSKIIFYHVEGPTENSRASLHVMENQNSDDGEFIISYFCHKDQDTHYIINQEEILDHLKNYNCFEDDYEPTFNIPINERK